ncbi:unnamed protein product [Boreogadus saida]
MAVMDVTPRSTSSSSAAKDGEKRGFLPELLRPRGASHSPSREDELPSAVLQLFAAVTLGGGARPLMAALMLTVTVKAQRSAAYCCTIDSQTFCRREPCDCGDPREDLSCCPSCDQRPSSQCLDQSGRLLYRSGASWLYNCHQCHCMEGEVEVRASRLVPRSLTCAVTAAVGGRGECCPRCVSDPCQAERLPYDDVRRTCRDPAGAARLSGASWRVPSSPCTTCKCKNGNVCCSVDPDCLQNY